VSRSDERSPGSPATGLPATPSETWHYDALGRLDRAVDFDGQVTDFHYDPEGRVLEKDEYAGAADEQRGVSAAARVVTYTYDAVDGPTLRHDTVTVTDRTDPAADGTVTSSYDAEGRLAEVDSTEGGLTAAQGDVSYGYDPVTGLKTDVTTAATHVRYAYDQEGRLATVTADKLEGQSLTPPLVTTYRYDPAGNLVETDLPNGTAEARGYDRLNRLSRQPPPHCHRGSGVVRIVPPFAAPRAFDDRRGDPCRRRRRWHPRDRPARRT
jgi:YD repeat-containing protein